MKEEVKSSTNSFTLPDEVITLKFIPRKTGLAAHVDSNHIIAGGMLPNAVRRFAAPLQRNGSIKNVLTNEEKEYLENITGLNLSVYGDFWFTYYVNLYKEDTNNILNLNNPMDYISYKILESLTKEDIAPSWSQRNDKQTYQFAITREDEEIIEKKNKFDFKKEAFKLYGKIEDDKSKLLGVLKLLTNKPISPDSTLLWLQSKVEEIIDNKPSSFLSVVNDKGFFTKLLINEGLEKGIILKKSNKYSTIDGLDLCESGEIPTFDNATKYLDDPRNQEVRAILEAKISKAK
jgi:hypothetical protein